MVIGCLDNGDPGGGMKWRVLMEITDADGAVTLDTVSAGERPGAIQTAGGLGLTPGDGKAILAGLQRRLVQAQAVAHCRARRRCGHCGSLRPIKDHRTRRLTSAYGTVDVGSPRFGPCRCGVACRRTLTPVSEIIPDRCTPEYERILALVGSALPYRQARTLLAEVLPLAEGPDVETVRQRTLRVGARLERAALVAPEPAMSAPPTAIVLALDGGHVRSVRTYQMRSFEVLIARARGADGREIVFSTMPAEADRQTRQLQHLLVGLGATPTTPVTLLSDGAEGLRTLGVAASPGPVEQVLDWFHLSMRTRHVAQAVQGWTAAMPADRERTVGLADTVTRVRWRLWHGQVERALALIGEALVDLTATPHAEASSPTKKVITLLRSLETYVAGQAELIIDYGAARLQGQPISTATTESTVQRLLHRRMGATQQMRWSPRGAHLMLKVRTATMNGTFRTDHVKAEPFARRPFRKAA